ncbi:MAG: glutathione S-transferase family protein [Leptolyngbyaceae cyanobacterium]
MATLTLYGTPVSTYVRTVRLLLAEANADYELIDVGIFNGDNETEEHLRKHPFGKVPALAVDDQYLYETNAITSYLNQTVANHSYTPTETLTAARMQQILSIVDSYLYSAAIGTVVIQRLIVPQQGGEPDENAVKAAIAPVKKALEAIEQITVGSPFLLGSLISVADFYLIPIFVYLSKTPEFDAVTANTPKLRVWWEQVKSLDSVKQVCG